MTATGSALSRFAPRRPLGRTGFVATALGAGDLADPSLPLEACADTLRRALDAGVNVVDTAPNYEDGLSERIVGRAVAGRRDAVFVVDKVDHLDAPVAPQVEASLGRLGHAYVDLFAFHAVSSLEDWAVVATRLEELERCRDAGQARFVGLSSHHPAVLAAALDDGRCDVLMFPVGPFVDARYVDDVLPRARAAGVGTIGFKAFGGGKLLGDSEGYGRPSAVTGLPRLTVEACLRYTLTLDPDVALLGLSSVEEQDAAFAAAAAFTPMTPEELAETRRLAGEAVAGKGRVWWNPQA